MWDSTHSYWPFSVALLCLDLVMFVQFHIAMNITLGIAFESFTYRCDYIQTEIVFESLLIMQAGQQHWEVRNQKILRDAIFGALGVFPQKDFEILDVLWCILETSVIDFGILFYDRSLHYFLRQTIHKIDIILLY